jgi:hypothetical protein
MDNKRQGRNVFVSTFRVPDEYERSRMEAERRAALAEMLEAQAYQPLNVNQPAPIAPSQGLAKVLKQYMGAYEKRKAREAEEKAKGEELETAAEIQGRLMGVDQLFDRDKTGEMQSIYATPEQQQAQIEADIARQRATGQLEEMTPTAQYQRDPMDALRLASTPAGVAATRGNPTLAAMLQKSLETDKASKSPYGSIDPAKFTAESMKEFDASVQAGRPDYTKLMPREYSELTPQQMYDLAFRTGEFGLKGGEYQFKTGQTPPQLQIPNFLVGTQTFGPAAPQAPTPQAAAAPSMPAATPAAPLTTPVAQPETPAVSASVSEARADRGPSAIELATPEQRLKLQQEIPIARRAALAGLSKLDRLDNILADLENHLGLENISGLIGQIPIDASAEARSARSKLNEFKEATSLQAVQEARESSATGGAYGNMTVQEWPRLESFFGSVVASKDPEDLLVAIQNARRQIVASRNLYTSTWRDTYGNLDIGYSPTQYTPESARFRKGGQNDVRSRADAILRGE